MNDPRFPWKRRFDLFIGALILISTGLLVYDTAADLSVSDHTAVVAFDTVVLGIFLVEYLARLWTVEVRLPEAIELTTLQIWRYRILARLRWASSPLAMIDLLALAPLFASNPSVGVFRLLRLLRTLRLVRAFTYNELYRNLNKAFRSNLLLYGVAFSFVGATILLGTISFYMVEGRSNPSVRNPWDALWWTIVTITTVGYGDTVPTTDLGRWVAIVLMLAGMFLVAIFAGVISQTLVGYLLDVREERVRMSTVVNQVVICGWNSRGPMVVEELTNLDHDREIVIMATREIDVELPDGVTFVRGEPTKEAELDKVRMGLCSSVVVLASGTGEHSMAAADGHTALVVYTIRSYEAKLGGKGITRKIPIHVCAELMDPENYEHIKRAGADEVVHTAQIGSNLVAHASARPGMGQVFTELLSWWGQQIDIDVLPPGLSLPVTFEALTDAVRDPQRFLPIGIVRANGQVLLNPVPDEELAVGDRFVFLRPGSPDHA